MAGLVDGGNGSFYGTTYSGHGSSGTIFELTAEGTINTLVRFNGINGATPYNALITGGDGFLYGTTSSGGTHNLGTVFKVSTTGVLTTLVNFNGDNGSAPRGLVKAANGDFYGATAAGGINAGPFPSPGGTVYRMKPDGTLTTLVKFNGTNGSNPQVPLVQGSDGHFYGTTYGSDPMGDQGQGTVFRMTASGTLITLFNFTGPNGSAPHAPLLEGEPGIFWGTTYYGGRHNKGTAFRMTSSGTLTTLVHFNGNNGSLPTTGLTRGPDGHLYGATSRGGMTYDGTPTNGGVYYRLLPYGARTALSMEASGPAVLSSSGLPEMNYRIERSSNLRDWGSLQTLVADDFGKLSYTDSEPLPERGFYRFVKQ
jgi:uncharacterized repeat protein (TIGR03803 family)